MSKNGLIWVFALISIIALPIVNAQSLSPASQIILVLINAAIVGTVLFVLQSFLIPGKDGKEKTAVYVAILVGSLLIAFMYGRTSFIWQGPLASFFSMYVIVNATIIGIFLYFLISLLPGVKDKLGGKEGSVGLGIIIFLISLFFAVKLGNQWIWDQNSIRQLVAYLFGAEGILNPDPPAYRLYTFIGGFFLLAFFFRYYLIKDAGGPSWVNYGLAFLIASSMARSGYSLQSIIILGELIFFLVLAQALDTAGTKKFNWLVSFILVGWASAAATYGTEYQGLLATLAGWPLVKLGLIAAPATGAAAPSGWGWWLLALLGLLIFALPVGAAAAVGGKWGILAGLGVLALLVFLLPGIGLTFFIIVGLILAFVFWAMKRAGIRNRVLGEGFTRLMNKVRDLASQNETVVNTVGKLWSLRSPTIEGELHNKLKSLRLEIYTLMNFMLRHDVWNSKRLSFEVLTHKIEQEEEKVFQKMVYVREGPAASIKTIVEGSQIIKNNAGFWELGKGKEALDDGTEVEAQGRRGIGQQHWLIYELANFIKLNLEQELNNLPHDTDDSRIEDEADQVARLFSDKISEHRTAISDYYDLTEKESGRYFSAFKRFGLASWIRSYRLYFIDMYNFWGTYKRGFFFAKPDAIPDYHAYTAVSTDGGITRDVQVNKNVVTRFITLDERRIYKEAKKKEEDARTPAEKAVIEKVDRIKKTRFFDKDNPSRLRENFETGNYLLELDLFGYCLQDWNRVAIDGASKTQVPYIRRYHKEDMWELYQPMDAEPRARFSKIMTWSLKDWEFAVKDFGRGAFHPYSKRWADYNFISEKGLFDYTQAKFKTSMGPDQLAFDREGLKALHKIVYWGRRNYWDEQGQNLLTSGGIVNPYPALSVEGLWEFISTVARRAIKEPEKLEAFMHQLQMEYAYLEQVKKGGEGGG